MGPTESVRELVEPLLTAEGLECWDVELASGLLRVLVDRPGGVDLETLGAVTEVISAALDETDAVPGGRYQLEVSSPGVERTLRTPAQYQRYVGTLIAVKSAAAIDGQRRFRGILLAVDDEGITLGDETGEGAARRLAYHDIQKAHTVLVWGPTPKPGTSGHGGRAAHSGVRAAAANVPMKDNAS